MKKTSLKLSALAAGFILAGCGGGSSTTGTTQTSKISGTVPGTLIEAFCEDGSYYSVNSDNSVAGGEHPFEIEIPSTVSCRLVMTTNENNETTKVVTPIGIITTNASGTLFTAAADIDLGHISLAMHPDDINDTNKDGVSDDILSIQVDNDPMDDDSDGLLNVYDNDDDGDGITNDKDVDDDDDDDDDDDNDGIDDDEDDDDDNDGIDDIEETESDDS